MLAEDLERRRAGEQFAVLYPGVPAVAAELARRASRAAARRAPYGHRRWAAVLAFGREYLDRSVYDVRALQSEFELPVLAEIPRIASTLARRRQMSRIQQILSKAERDGTARRMRSLDDARQDSEERARLHTRPRQRRPTPAWPRAPSRNRSTAHRPARVDEFGVVDDAPAPTTRPASSDRRRERPSRSRGSGPEPAARRGPRPAVAGRRAIPLAAQPHRPRGERSGRAGDPDHEPGQGRRQDRDGAESRADHGAGVPAAGARDRCRSPAAARARAARAGTGSRPRRRADRRARPSKRRSSRCPHTT